jgi:WD40 repeat protein
MIAQIHAGCAVEEEPGARPRPARPAGAASAGEPVAWKALPRGGPRPELVLQIGHMRPIQNAAMSMDGRRLATAAHQTILWDPQTGRMVSSFGERGPGYVIGTVVGVAFSPDGRLLVSGDAMWDTVSGARITAFDPPCYCAAFSPDGRQLITGNFRSASLWDVASGRKIRDFAEEPGLESSIQADGIVSVAYSPDGRRMLTADGRGTVTLWSAESGEKLRSFHVAVEHPARLRAYRRAVFHPRGRQIATAYEKTIVLWDAETGRRIREFETERQIINLAFSHDGRFLAGGGSARVVLWELASGKIIHRLPHGHLVFWLEFDSDDRTLMTADPWAAERVNSTWKQNPKMLFWDVASGKLVRTMPLRPFRVDPVRAAFHPTEDTILLGGDVSTTWSLTTGRMMRPGDSDGQARERLRAYRPGNTPSARSRDGRWQVAMGNVHQMILYDVETGAATRTFTTLAPGSGRGSEDDWFRVPYGDAEFSPDGKSVFVSCNNSVVFQWDLATGRELRRFGDPVADEVMSAVKRRGADFTQILPGPKGRWLLT